MEFFEVSWFLIQVRPVNNTHNTGGDQVWVEV
jgi:hypothetical protein